MVARPSARLAGVIAVGLASATALAACTAQAAADDNTIRFAVTDVQGLEELQREYGAFETEFEEATGLNLEFYPVTDRTAAAAALDNDHVDMVFTGPAEYVVIHERTGATPVIALERPGYRACIYTSVSSGITDVAQLDGKKVAMTDIGSTSGHLAPAQVLLEAGLDTRNGVQILTVGDAVHETLKRGDVDAVGVGCHYYERFMEAEDDPSQYVLLKEGEILPPDLLVAREGLSDDVIETVRDAYRENFDVLLAAMLQGDDNAKYENARLVEVNDADYDVVRSMYRAIGVDEFDEFVGD